jgi:Preprotein translocase subunit SecA (ATPase, RNA helicase)
MIKLLCRRNIFHILTSTYHKMNRIVNKFFGSINSNSLKKYAGFVEQVNKLDERISNLSDQEIKDKTNYFKNEFKETGSINKLLPEIFGSGKRSIKITLI